MMTQRNFLWLACLIVGGTLLWLSQLPSRTVNAGEVDPPVPAPELTQQAAEDWINSAPLRLADLQGKVVMIDFWTFGCWNCYRSFPWLRSLEARYKDEGLQVIGVHTPEFDHEKVKSMIVEKVKEFELPHPVMIDNDFVYWKAMRNRYWPTYYLLDKKGRIRYVSIGETHEGDKRAGAVEKQIKRLLAEQS